MKVGILTVSDKGARGEREDRSGPAIREMIEAAGGEVVRTRIVPDEPDEIRAVARRLVGRGPRPRPDDGRDRLQPARPDARGDQRPSSSARRPGLAEAMRRAGAERTPTAILSRAAAGIRKATLIVNLPGSEKAVRESLGAIMPALPHGVDILRGRPRSAASPIGRRVPVRDGAPERDRGVTRRAIMRCTER